VVDAVLVAAKKSKTNDSSGRFCLRHGTLRLCREGRPPFGVFSSNVPWQIVKPVESLADDDVGNVPSLRLT